jgi:hypothetical protein
MPGGRDPAPMTRSLLLVPVLAALLLAPAGQGDDLPQLVGTVGPGFTIDLKDATGRHVDVLTEGSYQLVVHDLSDTTTSSSARRRPGKARPRPRSSS